MHELLDIAERGGSEVAVARPKPHIRHVLEADGVVSRLGEGRSFGDIDQAMQALRRNGVADAFGG